jgi:hypothetical protein
LLCGPEAPAQYRASGGLQLVIARALGKLDLPEYASLEDFCAALDRFAVPDLPAAARTLFQAWATNRAAGEAAAARPTLTISDVRRARRATGLSLDDLAAVADVPAARLRELEWGYLRHWRADDDGRDRVIRYARAAGLDEALVLSIAWPMIEEEAAMPALGGIDHEAQPEMATALVPSGPQEMIRWSAPNSRRGMRSWVQSWGLVTVTAFMLALTTFALATQETMPSGFARDAAAPPRPVPTEVSDSTVASATAEQIPEGPVAAVPTTPKARTRAAAPARPAVRRAQAPAKKPSKLRSFFHKELFRIVIK